MRVLIALDDSAVSVKAARVAVGLFPSPDTEFLVINVANLAVPWSSPGGGFGMVSAVPGYDLLSPEGLGQSELLTRAEQAGVERPEILTDAGDPAACICAAADEHDVAVIVVGSHDKRLLARLLDPSVATEVVRSSHRPVLVVSEEPSDVDGTD